MNQTVQHSKTIVKSTQLSEQKKDRFRKLFLDYLKTHKLRTTPQRRLILETVLNSKQHLDAESITNIVKQKDPSVGVATVYRTLRMITSAKFLVERHFDGTRAQFEFVDSAGEHHDHIICTQCKKIVEFFNEELETLQVEIAQDLNFTLQNHRMELFGVCQRCQKLSPQNSSGP